MATRPRVGVTGNAKHWSPSWWCTRLALALTGAEAVRISTRQPGFTEHLQALIIGGGDDISAEHYDGDITRDVKIDAERDQLELQWIKRAIGKKIPVLGICRGAQLINIALGGNLHQDIRPMRKLTYNRRGILPTKRISINSDSLLAACTSRKRMRVNSLHHQAIDRLGDNLQVTARDLDQIVQAIEHQDRSSLIGVQWHPEYLCYLPSQLALFRWLVGKAKEQQR
ncbi:MAG: hypothetical protein CMP91_03945 [Gammaproteobacteria bacterium]|nr:hypothetical protein [Gammaproteobacteria bacterium]MAY01780.1 hypothetical protein [Gammaproteobacteria bacterium]